MERYSNFLVRMLQEAQDIAHLINPFSKGGELPSTVRSRERRPPELEPGVWENVNEDRLLLLWLRQNNVVATSFMEVPGDHLTDEEVQQVISNYPRPHGAEVADQVLVMYPGDRFPAATGGYTHPDVDLSAFDDEGRV
jgi:hypothetical protein